MLIESYTKNGYSIEIGYDETDYLFDDLWFDVSFISNHRHYKSIGEFEHLTIEHIIDKDLPDNIVVVPVYAYIHGGIALSLGEFNCQWDSGCFGFLLFKKDDHDDESLKNFVQLWNNILNGNVYYLYIYDKHNTYECCGGFTDIDELKKEVDMILKSYVKYDKKLRDNKLKVLIKNKVPLQYRSKILSEVA